MSQDRAVCVVGGIPPEGLLLQDVYLETEPRGGRGPLGGLCSLPGHLGAVASFQEQQGEGSEIDLVAYPSLPLRALTGLLSFPFLQVAE